MSLQGDLEFRDANKITFIGGSSNTLIDLTTGSLGVGVTGTSLSSNLHVAGNKIKVGDNIFSTDGPHARLPKTVPLKKYPEIVFESGKFDTTEIVAGSDQYWNGLSTVFQGGYSLKTTHYSTDSGGNFGWMAFDGNSETFWKNIEDYDTSGNYDYGYTGIQQRLTDTNSTNHDGDHVIMGSPNALKMAKVTVTCKNSDRRVVNYSVLGSNSSGTTGWTLLDSGTFTAQDVNTATISSPTSYFKYHAFVVRSITASAGGTRFQINSIDFYGYEEDPPAGDTSMDTTFTSIMNTPQTTGANVYVDAKLSSSFTNQVTGPTPVGTAATHDNTNKYWELTGELTSNITVEANTFLEGDQPHAVSVWFNSSNLEANVSNTCVFSVSDQEKLDSLNLDLQSNTWHNLTYAYQGEGGSRVTYLDGRKVVEDQAEDTFGDYPPFAMTGYTQGGYVVSASSQLSTYVSWYAFDDQTAHVSDDNSWICHNSPDRYDRTSGEATSAAAETVVDGVQKRGEWIQMEFPNKMCLSYIALAPQTDTEQYRAPKEGVIAGSNDGTTWETLHAFANQTSWTDNVFNNYVVNTNVGKGYKYVRIIIEKVQYDGTLNDNRRYTSLAEIRFYGHRENDLVRLPDPTNVLKYPHIHFPIGPNSNEPTGIRGYVASASSSSNSGIGRRPWSAFNDLGEGKANLGGLWQNQEDGANHKYTPQTTGLATTHAAVFEGVYGEWIKLELPHKIKVSQVYILTSGAHEGIEKAILYGSNNDIDWDVIKDSGTAGVGFTFTLTTNGGLKEATESVTTSNYYKYLLLQVTEVVVGSGTSDGRSLQLYKLQYFGTEEATPVPIQIGGGNIDKVANFRVYDKFVEEDQALEIWDAQKDEFGRAKSSMTLHKGRLGLGTEEPEGRLAVLDEPHNLEEFPPRAMTGYKNHFEGHGEFCVNGSGAFDNNLGSIYYEWYVFDHKHEHAGEGPSSAWYTLNGTYYNGVDNSYSGTSQLASGVPLGDFVKLELPYRVNVRKFVLTGPNTESEFPRDFTFYGSNDNNTWNSLLSVTGAVLGTNSPNHRSGVENTLKYAINSSTFYKYYAIVITKGNSYRNTYVGIGEWRLFGTREQGQSVLHDGQLTLTKNLDVHRIGPDLDADDTPRRDRLVVEYNTSTNPTFEGAVRDTSGRGNDGVFYGDATYDASNKAITLSDGTDDYVESGKTITRETPQHTFSFWLKPSSGDHDDTANHYLVVWGSETAQNKWSGIALSNDGRLAHVYHASGKRTVDQIIPTVGSWYHVVVVVNSTIATTAANRDIDIYVDGDLYTGTYDTFGSQAGSTSYYLDWRPGTLTSVRLGSLHNGSEDSSSSLSTIKLYDTALTAEEVKTLYDMGRCDEGHHVVNFSKTRVGIGLGDGGAPRGALDVRDKSVFSSILCQASHEDLKRGVESEGVHEVLLTFEGKKTTTDNKIHEGIQFKHYSSHQTGYRGITWQSSSDYNSSQPDFFMGGVTMAVGSSYNSCSINFHAAAARANGETRRAFIDSGNNGNRITTFTGQHRCGLRDVHLNNIESYEGIIVSANKNEYMNVNGDISRGSNAITINESIPIVTLSNIEKDKKCFGVISTSEDPETREEQHGNLTSLIEKEKGDNRVYINSVGEGAIWVVNTNGSLESGDYITTSNVAGYGQKQDDDVLHNYTVAKITMDCDFEPVTQPIQIIKKDEEGENVLDEHGQIQWEDHPTETEKAYKVRYLTTDGIQTDEANAVHIAAFVGCTYHCG
jgi:hypothetical protein